MEQPTQRSLREIANEIITDHQKQGKRIYFGAIPYLQQMRCMELPSDTNGFERGRDIIAYFLCNAQTWKGETARRVKKELNAMIK